MKPSRGSFVLLKRDELLFYSFIASYHIATPLLMINTDYHTAEQQLLFNLLRSGDSDCAEFFIKCEEIEKDRVLSARDKSDGFECFTLLHESAILGYTNAIHYLLCSGANIDVFDSSISRRTPIMMAIENGKYDAVALLAKHGSNLSLQDSRGENAIHYAARNSVKMIRILLKFTKGSGQDVKSLLCITNNKHKFPEDVGVNTHVREVLSRLREIESNGE